MITNRKKIILIRLDKIGDLVCTLPVDQVLDPKVYDITWVVQKGMGQILDLADRPLNYIELDKSKPDIARSMLSHYLKKNKFDIAISFQCPWWVNFELFWHHIPRRIGVLSQWHSFLFLNQGLRQKRSESIQHEFEYNLELVEKLIGSIQNKDAIAFRFRRPSSSKTLEKHQLKNYIVVHPGMMGSALNWPQEKYIEYIQGLIDQSKTVVITGTASDEPYLTQIKNTFKNHPQVKWLQSVLNFSELLEILNFAEYVVAPSTGVAHLAASLGKHIKAIYSPIQVHHPRRWKPRKIYPDQQIEIFVPEVSCPGTKSCLQDQCPHFPCMNSIKITEIV